MTDYFDGDPQELVFELETSPNAFTDVTDYVARESIRIDFAADKYAARLTFRLERSGGGIVVQEWARIRVYDPYSNNGVGGYVRYFYGYLQRPVSTQYGTTMVWQVDCVDMNIVLDIGAEDTSGFYPSQITTQWPPGDGSPAGISDRALLWTGFTISGVPYQGLIPTFLPNCLDAIGTVITSLPHMKFANCTVRDALNQIKGQASTTQRPQYYMRVVDDDGSHSNWYYILDWFDESAITPLTIQLSEAPEDATHKQYIAWSRTRDGSRLITHQVVTGSLGAQGSYTDTASETQYGRRVAGKPIVDTSLTTNAECDARARAIVLAYGKVRETISTGTWTRLDPRLLAVPYAIQISNSLEGGLNTPTAFAIAHATLSFPDGCALYEFELGASFGEFGDTGLPGFQGGSTTVRDTTPPAVPTGLATLENVYEGATHTSRWHISWNPNTDGDLDHYVADTWYYDGFIYRHTYTIIDRGTADLDLPGRTPGVTYYAAVRAVDTSGNASIYCTPISVASAAADSPAPPTLTFQRDGFGGRGGAAWFATTITPPGSLPDHYTCYYTPAGGAWRSFRVSPASTKVIIPVDVGVAYQLYLKSATAYGDEGAPSNTITHTVLPSPSDQQAGPGGFDATSAEAITATNPGFTNWPTLSGTGHVNRDTSVLYSGQASAAMTLSSGDKPILTSIPFPVKDGAAYVLRMAARRNTTTSVPKVTVHSFDSAGTPLADVVPTLPTVANGSWTALTLSVTLPAGAVTASLELQATDGGAGGAQTVYWAYLGWDPRKDTVDLSPLAVDSTILAAGAVTAGKIAAAAINAANLFVAGVVDTSALGANAVTTAKLALLAVDSTILAAGAVTAGKIAAGGISAANQFAAGVVDTSALGANAVTTAKLALLAVDSTILAAGAVTAGKIAAGGISAANQFAAGVVDTSALGANAVTTAKLALLSVDSTILAANAVTAGKIASGAINAAGLFAAGVVDTAALGIGAVGADNLAVGTVSANLISNPSFEQGTAGWSRVDGSGTFSTAAATDAPSGDLVAVLPGGGAIGVGARAVAVAPGRTYQMRLTVKASAGGGAWYFRIFERTDYPTGGYITAANQTSFTDKVSGAVPPTSWTTYDFTYTVPAGIYWAGFTCYNLSAAGTTLWADDAHFLAQTEANALASAAVTAGKIAVGGISAANQFAAGVVDTSALGANAVTTAKLALLAVDSTILAAGAVTAGKIAVGGISASAQFAAGVVDTSALGANAVTTAKLALLAVDSTILAAGAVTAGKIAVGGISAANQHAAGVVDTAALAANAVTTAKLALLAVDSTILAAGAVTAGKIATGGVSAAAQFAAGVVDTTALGANAVTTAKIAANAVGTGQLALLAVDSTILAAGAVTAGKIAVGGISAANQHAAGVVDTAALAANAVTTAKLALLAVDSTILAAGAVTAGKIATGGVSAAAQFAAGVVDTTALGANAVTTAKIAANAVGTGQLALLAVDSTILAAGAVTAGKIATGGISAASQFAAGVVDTSALGANAVTTAKLALLAVDSTILAAGAVTAGKIAVGGVSAANQFAAGVVDTSALGANAVTRAKLLDGAVGPAQTQLGTDLLLNGSMEIPDAAGTLPSGWTKTGTVAYGNALSIGAGDGQYACQLGLATGTHTLVSPLVQWTKGRGYSGRVRWLEYLSVVGASLVITVTARWYNAAGTYLSSTTLTPETSNTAGAWATNTVTWDGNTAIPANTAFVAIQFQAVTTSGTPYYGVDALELLPISRPLIMNVVEHRTGNGTYVGKTQTNGTTSLDVYLYDTTAWWKLITGAGLDILTGQFKGASAALTGALTAASAAISGAITAASAALTGNLTVGSGTSSGTVQNTGSGGAGELKLLMSGDAYGGSELWLQNRGGVNGALFYANMSDTSIRLIDFVFRWNTPSGTSQRNIRIEDRSAYVFSGSNPEFQFGNPGDPDFAVSAGGAILRRGILQLAGHLVTGGSTPAVAAGTGAGTGPTVTISGNDTAGKITVVTGTTPALNGVIATITFATAFGATPKGVQLTAGNANAAGVISNVYYDDATLSTTLWKLVNQGTALAASKTYIWSYSVDG